MKATIISMIIVLCVLAIIPIFLMDDNSIVARLGLGIFTESEPAPQPPKNLTTVTTDVKVQVYKWRDEYGVVQFTSSPPPEAQDVEIVELTPNTNIVKAVEVPEDEPEAGRSGPRVMKVGNPYTPGGMQDLLGTTSALAEDMSQQQMEQQKMMEQLLGIQK